MNPELIQSRQYVQVARRYMDDVIVPAFAPTFLQHNLISKTFLIAGKPIRIQSASLPFLEFMTQAFAHHAEVNDISPSLTINLLDSTTTRVHIPAPWEKPQHFLTTESSNKGTGDASFIGVFMNGEETLNLYDKPSHTAYFWAKDSNTLPHYIAAAPLRTILHWYLSECSTYLVHGALIGNGEKTILLTAKSGSGKSTTALSCLMSGMKYLADDYGAIEVKTSITAHSLYSSIKILPDGFATFPTLKDFIWNKEYYGQQKDDGKGIVFLQDTFQKQIQSSNPLAAILVPKITGGPTKIVPTTKAETMLALIPPTVFQLPPFSTSNTMSLRSIIERTPCYRLELGLPLQDVPQVIKNFLDPESTI